MAANKTQATRASVSAFIDSVADGQRRADCRMLMRLMRRATGKAPRMWGPSIVGYGTHHYRYASGREGDSCTVGFSPRKQELTIYLMGGLEMHAGSLRRLGPHRTGKGCLYLKRLEGVDLEVLEAMIERAFARLKSAN